MRSHRRDTEPMTEKATRSAEPRGRLSTRIGFLWNLGGISVYNVSQWLLLLVLARLANPEAVGSFSLILAIAGPITLTVGMNLQTALVTDAARRWRLEEYILLRQILNAVAIVLTMIVGVALHMRGWTLAAVAVVAVAKSVEARSQIFYGYFQSQHRLDLVSRSLWARAVTGPILFLLGFWATHNLAIAALGLVVGWGGAQLLLDQPNARRLARDEGRPLGSFRAARGQELKALARKAAPLGIDQGISSLYNNLPRYLIRAFLGTAHLGVYSSQASLGLVISTINNALVAVFSPSMAMNYHRGERGAFVRRLIQLLLFGIFVLVVGLVFGAMFGEFFIRITLGAAYVNQPLLLAVLASAGVATIRNNLSSALTASRAFRSYLLIDVINAGGVLASGVPLIETFGLIGAPYSVIVGSVLGSIAALIALVGVMRRMPTVS